MQQDNGKGKGKDPANAGPPSTTDQVVTLEKDTGKYVRKDSDGITFEWDPQRNAWFPRMDPSALERQQSVYEGQHADQPSAATAASASTSAVARSGRPKKVPNYTGLGLKDQQDSGKKKEQPKKNTAVYVTGLPLDVTMDEMATYFGKCGIIMDDLFTDGPKIKLYKDAEERPKGDALVVYLREESVSLACSLLDDSDFRQNQRIQVQKAVFQEKTSDAIEKKRKIDKNALKRKRLRMEKKLDWYDTANTDSKKQDRYRKIVVLKQMFTLEEIENDPTILLDLKDEIREECETLGDVTAINVFDKNEQGACSVKFKEELSAMACVKMMNGRFFDGRKVEAYIYDGKEDLKGIQAKETEEETKARLEKYAEWLESQE